MTETRVFPISRAWSIDQRVRELVRKMIYGEHTQSDWTELQELTCDRARELRPQRPMRMMEEQQ